MATSRSIPVPRSATLRARPFSSHAKRHRPRVKATDEELQRCRQNPSLADQLYPGLVVCLECGVLAKRLVRSPKCHARRDHPDIDYPAKWPTAPLYGKGVHEADLKQHHDYVRNNREAVNTGRRDAYGRKLKKAEEDPTSPEAVFINGERTRTADLWNEKYWGAATAEGVKQLEVGAKADPTGPAAKKLEAAAAFRADEKLRKQQRAPRCNQRNKELLEERKAAAEANPTGPEAVQLKADRERAAAEQRKIRRLARRPKCWNRLEDDQQALWLILNENPEAKGRALGKLLDHAMINCKFGTDEIANWQDVLGNKKAKNYGAAKMHISRIRNLK